jgi:hypothetical protein
LFLRRPLLGGCQETTISRVSTFFNQEEAVCANAWNTCPYLMLLGEMESIIYAHGIIKIWKEQKQDKFIYSCFKHIWNAVTKKTNLKLPQHEDTGTKWVHFPRSNLNYRMVYLTYIYIVNFIVFSRGLKG